MGILEGGFEPDGLGDVFELPVAEVAVEASGKAQNGLAVVAAPAGKEDVDAAVVVEVEEGDAPAERFDDRIVSGLLRVPIREVDADLLGAVFERRGAERLGNGFLSRRHRCRGAGHHQRDAESREPQDRDREVPL